MTKFQAFRHHIRAHHHLSALVEEGYLDLEAEEEASDAICYFLRDLTPQERDTIREMIPIDDPDREAMLEWLEPLD